MSNFLDHVFIEIRSGDGGNGMVAWRREKYEPMGGPAGGNGGRGGSIFVTATNDLNTLIDFRYKNKFLAENGARGGPKNRHGKAAPDLTLKVPVGTVVREKRTGKVICDLKHNGDSVMIAEGGLGGRGNAMMASSTRRAPHFCEPGQPGIERELELELKILADVAIVGLPNAGKSSLLSVMSRARPKIADYPFSTLEPNLGVVKEFDGSGYVMADIPGLIEGASQGVGLGHEFLRHVERTRVLVHLVDISSETLEIDIETIVDELKTYRDELGQLPRLLVLNKSDLLLEEEIPERIERARLANEKAAKKLPARRKKARQSSRSADTAVKQEEAETHSWESAIAVFPAEPLVISAVANHGLKELNSLLESALQQLPVDAPLEEHVEPDPDAYDHKIENEGFSVARSKNVFTVSGDKVNRLVAVTNMRSPESIFHLYQVLRSIGVLDALKEAGANAGMEVILGGVVFEYGPEFY